MSIPSLSWQFFLLQRDIDNTLALWKYKYEERHVSVKRLVCKGIFPWVEVVKALIKMGKRWWTLDCRSILAFMEKEIKDAKRETRRKMLREHWSSFYSWKFIAFAKTFIIRWNAILYYWPVSPAINYGKLPFL